MSTHVSEEQKLQFYMQIATALIRRLGGSATITVDEFEEATSSIKHRPSPYFDGIEIMVVDKERPD